jgi:hypothetical protein
MSVDFLSFPGNSNSKLKLQFRTFHTDHRIWATPLTSKRGISLPGICADRDSGSEDGGGHVITINFLHSEYANAYGEDSPQFPIFHWTYCTISVVSSLPQIPRNTCQHRINGPTIFSLFKLYALPWIKTSAPCFLRLWK